MESLHVSISGKDKNRGKKKRFSISGFALMDELSAWVLILPAVLCIYFFILRPQLLGFYWSFFDMKGFTPTKFVGFRNYLRVLTDTAFLQTFVNTWKYVICSILIGFPIPFIVAMVMNELLHLRRFVRTVVYLPSIMPAVAVSLLWYFIYYPDGSGLLNMVIGTFGMEPYVWLQDGRFTILYIVLSMTWSGMGSTALYYFAALQGINRELYEAAVIDGAGFLRRVFSVTVPQMSGMLILFLIRQIIGVFNVMEQPMQMTGGGPNNASMSLGLLNYRYGFTLNRPQLAMSLGVIMFIILSVFTIIYFRVNKRIEDSQM